MPLLYIWLVLSINSIKSHLYYLHNLYRNTNITGITKNILHLCYKGGVNIIVYLASLAAKFLLLILELIIIIINTLLRLGILCINLLLNFINLFF